MTSRISAAVTAHVHRDLNVTPERVRAYGDASFADRLLVQAELRKTATSDSAHLEIALLAAVLALFSLMVAPSEFAPSPGWAGIAASVVLAVVAVVVLVPFMFSIAGKQNRHERAVVWLAAYADEDARRQAATGRKAWPWKARP